MQKQNSNYFYSLNLYHLATNYSHRHLDCHQNKTDNDCLDLNAN